MSKSALAGMAIVAHLPWRQPDRRRGGSQRGMPLRSCRFAGFSAVDASLRSKAARAASISTRCARAHSPSALTGACNDRPSGGELVFDPRRHHRENRALHQAVALETAQRQSQHPLGDAADGALELGEAPRPVGQHDDDEDAPLLPDARQHLTDLRAFLARQVAGGGGYIRFTGRMRVPSCIGAARTHIISLSNNCIPHTGGPR